MASDGFRKKVLGIVKNIPKGKVLSYGKVAALAGNPKAARAVGAILKTNYASDIPCHRVVRSDGKLGGYNRGAAKKRLILQEEGAILSRTSHDEKNKRQSQDGMESRTPLRIGKGPENR